MAKTTSGTTYYCLILDESGSMSHLTSKVKQLYLQKINDLRKTATDNKQKVLGSLIKFHDTVSVLALNTTLEELANPIYIENYRPDRTTALLHAIKTAMDSLSVVKLKSNDAVLVEIITDGQHNKWYTETWDSMRKDISKLEQTNQWTFVFQVPPGYKHNIMSQLGICDDNVREWENTSAGLVETVNVTTQGMGNYMKARAGGQSCTRSFYADVNLDKLSTNQVKANLNDLSCHFKILKVDKEQNVSEFVKEKLKRDLVTGSVYYQLTKPELLRKGRQILVMEKNKPTVWGGQEAYDLLKLPKDGNVHLNPGNLSNFDVFIESRANNRKLVRGTKVLFDKTKRVGETPTWQV